MSTKTFYEILEVDFDADDAAIRKAYLKKSLKYHPDKNPGNIEEAKAKFIEIGVAYGTLSDPAKRRIYDRELRTGKIPNGFGSGANFTEQTYESYMDAFDATVAGMSERELAIAVGTIGAVAGLVGSVVGGRMLGRRSSGARGSILSGVGSIVGSVVAQEAAHSSVRALHRDSINRLTYKEECRRALERGEPIPDPPQTSFIGNKIGDVLKNTVNSVTNFATEVTSQNKSNNFDSMNHTNSDNGYGHGNGFRREQSEGTGDNKFRNMWQRAAAGVRSGKSANQEY